LEDENFESFEELYDNDEIFTKLIDFKHLFLNKNERFSIVPEFIMAFTHNSYFYHMDHETDFVEIIFFI